MLLAKSVRFADLEGVDPLLYKGLNDLLETEENVEGLKIFFLFTSDDSSICSDRTDFVVVYVDQSVWVVTPMPPCIECVRACVSPQ